MKMITRCLFVLLTATLMCRGSNWYVATNGSAYSGPGTIGSPWSFQNATTNAQVQPGDTIWLRNGDYFPTSTFASGAVNVQGWMPTLNGNSTSYITISSYSNEWAAIDRAWFLRKCSYLCFSNVEFYDSLKGHNLTNSTNPNGPWDHFSIGGQPGLQWINCVIHDVDDCFSGSGSIVRGCIFWYVGWNRLEHVCYPAPNVFSGNISGWHMQNVINGSALSFVCSSNIMFGGGMPGNEANCDMEINTTDNMIVCNYCYNRLANATDGLALSTSSSVNAVIVSNVLVAPVPIVIQDANAANVINLSNNILYATSPNHSNPASEVYNSYGTLNCDFNQYFSTGATVTFMANHYYHLTLAQWQATNGCDLHSTAGSNGAMPPDSVYVIPNQDQPKRCHIAIYNWSLQNNVTVNLTNILNAGDSYNLYSAQNYNGGAISGSSPIRTGIFNGTSISVPMTNLTSAPILYGMNVNYSGESIVQPPPTSPEFAAFVVIGAAAANAAPLPPTDLRVISQ